MTEFQKNKWKYSTIGLLGVLAVGFSFPQAFAHITNNLTHNIGHILDSLGALQSDVDDINSKLDEPNVFMQIDIGNQFDALGDEAYFKLMADFTPMRVDEAHIAVSNVPCNGTGTSPFVIAVANANVGSGNTDNSLIALNSTNLIDDASDLSNGICTYHIDVDGDDYSFPVTDILLVNGGLASTPSETGSATISARLVQIT